MEYLRRAVHDLTHNFVKTKQEDVIEVSRIDAYFHMVYKILVWEDPMLSWATLGVFHVLFWIIVHFQLRLYGIIFLILLVAFLADLYFEQTGLQAQRNASSDTIREFVNLSIAVFLYLKALRKDSPSMFCGLMCSIFLGLSMVSRNVPGYFLAYTFSLGIFFGPLLVSKLPNGYKESIRNTIYSLSTNEGVLAETELIPFITNKELNERDPEVESLCTDKTADSVTSSLISGLSTMPSYLEAEGSLDGLEEDDFVPQLKASSEASHTPVENSSDSDSEHKNMRFESGHFNGDSSSEDENYTKGLRFSEVKDVTDSPSKTNLHTAMTQSLGAGIISNIAAMGTSLMSNVLKGPVTNTEMLKHKDSDSDFEIINSDEADDDEHT